MSKYIHILDNLSHDEKLIIDSEIQTMALSIKYSQCEKEVLVLAATRFNLILH